MTVPMPPTPTAGDDQEAWEAAVAAIRAYCGWHVAPLASETLRVEGGGGRVLLLPSLRVIDVTAVTDEDGREVAGWKVRENGIARGSWSDEVEYAFEVMHGYEEWPAELTGIAKAVMAGADIPFGVSAMSTGAYRVDYSAAAQAGDGAALSGSQLRTLARYRLQQGP